jgi:signal transduction histidine kinase
VNKQSHPDSPPHPDSRPETSERTERKRRRGKQPKSIKRRVVQLVLIPSAALIVLWFGASLYLFGTGFYDREVASSVQQVSIPAVRGLASVQKERQLSMAHLAQPSDGLQSLLAQQQQTDTELSAMRTAAASMMSSAPDSIVGSYNKLLGYLDQLPKIRGEIDAGAATQPEVYAFYNNLLDSAANLFDTQARVVPDVTATQGAIAAVEVFRGGDVMSRAGSLVSGAFASNSFSRQDFLQFASMVGAYHAALANVAPDLQPDVRAKYQQLTTTSSWQNLVNAENSIIARGPWTDGVPSGLDITASDWATLTDQNFSVLTDMTISQADEVSAAALANGNTQLLWAGVGSVIALGIAIAAIMIALRQSRVLVDRALVIRLARLRDEALALVAVRLPDIVRRLRDGQTVEVQEELPELDYGGDEIGQVATAINAAQRTAVAAAVQEAQARNGVHAVFLGIAHRNQRPLHRLLNLLDRWEQREQDPGQLERLFQLDHQATQARRNIENLIILGGGQLGRRWRTPVSVLEVLRAAIAETKQYARIKLQRVPEVTVTGDAVAGVIHLISELLDNAISFSSPEYPVQVSSKRVDLGVVVEVEDQGLGISSAERDRANQMMLEPPEFDVMALKDGSQLGFWVIAQLASRLGVRVELRESAYGGVLAIVLIPNRLLTAHPDELPEGADELDLPVAEYESTIEFPTLDPDAVYAGTERRSRTTPAHALSAHNGLHSGYRDQAAERLVSGWPDEVAMGALEAELPPRTMELPQRGPELPQRTPPEHRAESHTDGAEGWTASRADSRIDSPGRGRVDGPSHSRAEGVVPQQTDPIPPQPIAPPTPGERPPLPQRQPQQHLVRQLREGDPTSESGAAEDAEETPHKSPEEIRAKLSAFQRGTNDGRRTDDPSTP